MNISAVSSINSNNIGGRINDNNNVVREKAGKESIHSGHFMVSHFEAEAQDDEDELAVPVPEAPDVKTEYNIVVPKQNIEGRSNKSRFCFGTQIAIDGSLSKLFQCMSLAYRQKLTSPRWNRFRGVRLRWKDKIRLNNVIWRCWHLQFIKKRNTLICQFASPLDVDQHNKPEAVVLEGKYWKRKLAAVTAEYKKWRMFYRNQIAGNNKDALDMLEMELLAYSQNIDEGMHMMVDEDYMGLMSDTLFSTITNQPFVFPDSREIAKAGYADFIQPSLGPLQPNLDDYMDTFEPFHDMMTNRLAPVPEEQVNDLYKDNWYPGYQDISNTMHLQQPQNQQAMLPFRSNSTVDYQQQPQLQEQQQQQQQVLQQSMKPAEMSPQNMEATYYQQQQGNMGYSTNVMISKENASNTTTNTNILAMELGRQQKQQQQQQPAATYTTMTAAASLSLNANKVEQSLMAGSPNGSIHVSPLASPLHTQEQIPPQSTIQAMPRTFKFSTPHPPSKSQSKNTSQKEEKVIPRVKNPRGRPRSRSTTRETLKKPPLISAISDPSLINSSNSALLTQLLTSNEVATQFQQQRADKKAASSSSSIRVKEESSPQLLPQPILPQPTSAPLIITTPISLTPLHSIKLSSEPLILNALTTSSNSTAASSTNIDPIMGATSSSCLNSPTSSQDGSLGSPGREPNREQRRAGHIHAEQKRRYNIKNGFDMIHSLIPHLNQNPNAKLSKAAMLQKGADYIKQLRNERSMIKEEMESLRQQIENLNTSISNCQSLLPATGLPVSRLRDNKLQEMFEEYVQARTMEDWKFWIFSLLIQPLLTSFNNFVSTSSVDDLYRSTMQWVEQHCTLIDLRPVVLNSLRYLCTKTDVLSEPEKLASEARQIVISSSEGKSRQSQLSPSTSTNLQ